MDLLACLLNIQKKPWWGAVDACRLYPQRMEAQKPLAFCGAGHIGALSFSLGMCLAWCLLSSGYFFSWFITVTNNAFEVGFVGFCL
jgi:hypothetical protein